MNIKRQTLHGTNRGISKWLIVAVSAVAATAASRDASAEITVANAQGWELKLDGRVNGFISYASGDPTPPGAADWTAGLSQDPDPASGKIGVVRIRSGFVQNVLGFGLSKEPAEGYKLNARFALWAGASNEQKPILGQQPDVEAREAYVRLDAPWGSVQIGRDLGLFGRGGILMDGEIVHGNGLGNPCSTKSILGGACGMAGHGVLFPGFNAGALYSTPKFYGIQVIAGIYDPSINSEKSYTIAPYPRVEGQVSFNYKDNVKAFVEGMWQRLVNSTPLMQADPNAKPIDQKADASGVSAGAQIAFGPLQLGGAFYTGTGLTLVVPIFNTPIFADGMGVLRKGQGFAGFASLTFGGTKVAAALGESQLKLTPFETEPLTMLVTPKQQLGASIGLYQTFWKQLTFAIEYFRGQYTWYQYMPAGSAAFSPKQNMNFINTGLTLAF